MGRREITSRKLRRLRFYTVEEAGEMIGVGRSQSYRAAAFGQIPVERCGKFLLVPRKRWDREVRRLLGRTARRPRKEAPVTTAHI